MRLLPIIPYATLILVGQAALEAVPAVVAEREGGMGLGSALILAQAVQVATLALGATAAAYLIDRRLGPAVLLAGALLFYAGLFAVGLQPMGSLVWVIVAQGVAGAGFGIVLTASFTGAAAIAASVRPLAILVLLLAPLAARNVIGVTYLGGQLALTLVGATVVALSVFVARRAGIGSAESSMNASDTNVGRHAASTGAAALGGLMVAVGILATLVGADPSRVSAALMIGTFGIGFESLDGFRAGMLVGGLVVVFGASIILLRQRRDRQAFLAASAIALTTFAGAGMIAALNFVSPTAATVPGERTISLVSVAVMGGGVLGIALGAIWLARGGRTRVVATAGSLLLACAMLVGAAALQSPTTQLAPLAPLAVIVLIGLAGGVAATSLRLVLADVAAYQRGLAAAAGVVAASFGSVLGTMIGNGEGVSLVAGEPGPVSVGLLVFVAAALAAVVVARFVPPNRPAGAPTPM